MALKNEFALLDKAFLKKLDFNRNKEVYVKIVSLNWDEDPIAEITSNVASGSISVDNKSSVRRTCNITLVTNTETARVDEANWTLRTKFKVYVGIENTVDDRYENMIWFPQGTFVITSFSCTLNQSGYTLNIQGKDKMCLLNGDVGGALFAAHEFSMIYITKSDGTIQKEYIPIYTIVREAIHNYAQEPYWNIIINDLESCGVELIDYVGNDTIMYIYNQCSNDDVTKWNNTGYTPVEYQVTDKIHAVSSSQIKGEPSFPYRSLQIRFNTNKDLDQVFEAAVKDQGTTYDLKPFLHQGVWYQIYKRIDPMTDVQTTAGYRPTDLTYNGELMIDIGGTITQMLDKIIQMLGEFEYFYDVNGRFVFQRKRIYFNTSWSNAIVNQKQTYYDSIANGSADFYDFSDGYLIESFQNKPQLNVIKNDFSIWGSLTGVNDTALPIHLRYAIDRRPEAYYSLLNQRLYLSNAMNPILPDGTRLSTSSFWDWRELIYQMARDNLASRSRIDGLQQSLITLTKLYKAEKSSSQSLEKYKSAVRYHYDDKLVEMALKNEKITYYDLYKWDMIHSRFVALEDEKDYLLSKTRQEFLYGNNLDYIHLELSEKELQDMNNALGYDYYLAAGIDERSDELAQIDRDISHYPADTQESKRVALELYDYFMWLYDYYEHYLKTNDYGLKGFEDPDYQLNAAMNYYWRPGEKTESGQTWDSLGDTLKLQNQEKPRRTYFKNTDDCQSAHRGEKWTEWANNNLNNIPELNKVFFMGPTDTMESTGWTWATAKTKDHCIHIVPNGTLSVKNILNIILKRIKGEFLTTSPIQKTTYRNKEQEDELLTKLRAQSYMKIAQDELDAWQKTFNTGYDAYYADMLAFWPQLYRTTPSVDMVYDENGTVNTKEDGTLTYSTNSINNWEAWVQNGYWNPSYITYNKSTGQIHFNEPEALFFWIEFIDATQRPELQEYSVEIIGRRSKSVNDTNVKAIYVRDTPTVLFLNPSEEPVIGQEHLAYAKINIVPPISNYFRISAQGKSAKEALDTMLYESTYFQESITVSSIPIYYLEPNVRISVHDDVSGIAGEYLVQSFTIPLQHDGMMSITANRAVDRLL